MNVKLFGFLFPFPSIYTISRKRIAFRLERCNWSDSQFICDNRLVNVLRMIVFWIVVFLICKVILYGMDESLIWTFYISTCITNDWHCTKEPIFILFLLFYYSMKSQLFSTNLSNEKSDNNSEWRKYWLYIKFVALPGVS